MRFTARLDPRLASVVRSVDVGRPVAETWRDLGRAAAELEIWRPGYAAVRGYVTEERLRRAQRAAAFEVAAWILLSRLPRTPDEVERAFEHALRKRLG